MQLLFDLNHPAHFHLFKYVIKGLSEQHEILVTAKKKDVLHDLLLKNGLTFKLLETKERRKGLFYSALSQIKRDYKLLSVVKKFKPDLLIGTSISITHVGKWKSIPSLYFGEDGYKAVPLSYRIGYPFASYIVAPSIPSVGKYAYKQISYNGYHELAYLNQENFIPDKGIFSELGLEYGDRYTIIRFSALIAHHDTNIKGMNSSFVERLIHLMNKYGKVFITTEKELDKKFNSYRLSISADRIHHAIYYADAYVGDSQTMAAEAAVLGTPSFRISDFVGILKYLDELEEKYQLTHGYLSTEADLALPLIEKVLNSNDIRNDYRIRANEMFKDKINVRDFFTWLISNFPESIKTLESNSDYSNNFYKK